MKPKKISGPDLSQIRSGRNPYGEAGIRQMARPKTAKRNARNAKLVAIGILVTTGTFSTLGFFGMRGNSTLHDDLMQRYEEQDSPAFKIRYQNLGQSVVEAWYSNQPSPIDVKQGIKWPYDAQQNEELPVVDPNSSSDLNQVNKSSVSGLTFLYGQPVDGTGDRYEEQLTYLGTLQGKQYRITLDIAVPDRKSNVTSPVLVAPPALSGPRSVNLESEISESLPKSGKVSLGEKAQDQLEYWAKAWATNDGATLKQMTQDTEDRVYTGLPGGWELVPESLKVIWSYRKSGDDAIVRVSFDVQQPILSDKPSDTPNADEEPDFIQNTQTMDILISRYSTGLPNVVSWDSVGSWANLKPFSNGIVLEEGEATPSPEPSISDQAVDPSKPALESSPPQNPSPSISNKPGKKD